jgi:hypothetical protein
MEERMTEFLKKLINPIHPADQGHMPEGKRGVTSTIEVNRGKSFKVVREDILQKGLASKKTKQAA